MQQQAVEIVGAQVQKRGRARLRHLLGKRSLGIVRYLPRLLTGQRRELGLQIELRALEP